MCAIGLIHDGLGVELCFSYITQSHYYHYAKLLAVLNRYDERSGSQLMSVGYILSSVCLYMVNFANDFLCNMWDCMYATGPFRLRCSRCYFIRTASYSNQFSSIILFHCCCILSGLCVWGGCTVIFCQLLYIYSEKAGFLFQLPWYSLWCSQMIWHIKTLKSYSRVDTLHILIIISVQSCLESLAI